MKKIIFCFFVVLLGFSLLVPLSYSFAQAATTNCNFTVNLSVGSRGNDVLCLQQYLNVPNPTGYFGTATKAAVINWQNINGISPTGYFGVLSRAEYQAVVGSSSVSATPTTNQSSSINTTITTPAMTPSLLNSQSTTSLTPGIVNNDLAEMPQSSQSIAMQVNLALPVSIQDSITTGVGGVSTSYGPVSGVDISTDDLQQTTQQTQKILEEKSELEKYFYDPYHANKYVRTGTDAGTCPQWAYASDENGVCLGAYYAIDFARGSNTNPTATNITAASDGTIKSVSNNANTQEGKYILMDDTANSGYYTFYAHLDSISVNVGQVVTKGELIGIMGNTGSESGGTHLHFQILYGDYKKITNFNNEDNWKMYLNSQFGNPELQTVMLNGHPLSDYVLNINDVINKDKSFILDNFSGGTMDTPTPPTSGTKLPAPTCTMTTDNNHIQPGGKAVINWTSQNAQSGVFININTQTFQQSGSLTVMPTQTTTYPAIFTGASGTGNCSITIYVDQPTTIITPPIQPPQNLIQCNGMSYSQCPSGQTWSCTSTGGMCQTSYVPPTPPTPTPTPCIPNWQCSGFGSCVNGQQTQNCNDTNSCGNTTNEPQLTQSCYVTPPTQPITTIYGCMDSTATNYNPNATSQTGVTCTYQNSTPTTGPGLNSYIWYVKLANGKITPLQGGPYAAALAWAQQNGGTITNPPTTSSTIICTSNWQTGSWGICLNGQQTRTVTDSNNCGITSGEPATTQSCTVLNPSPGPFTLTSQSPVCDTQPPKGPAIMLNWTPSSGETYGYLLYKNGSLVNVNLGSTATSYYNSLNLTAGQTYSYYLTANNASGFTNSNTISVSIPANICVGH